MQVEATLKVLLVEVPLPPHTLGTPPQPQHCGAVQSPHWMMPPQPSGMGPQFLPTFAQSVIGSQGAHTLGVDVPHRSSGQ